MGNWCHITYFGILQLAAQHRHLLISRLVGQAHNQLAVHQFHHHLTRQLDRALLHHRTRRLHLLLSLHLVRQANLHRRHRLSRLLDQACILHLIRLCLRTLHLMRHGIHHSRQLIHCSLLAVNSSRRLFW